MKSTNLNIINTSSRFEKDVELKSTELSGNVLDKFLCVDSNGTVLLKSDADRSTFTNQVTLNTLENASADTDKFLVADSSGVIKFRTGSEMQSDLNVANVTLAGTPDYITISGQEITRNQIDLAADVTGVVPVANGGTGANNAAGARTSLGLTTANNITSGTLDVDVGGTGANSLTDNAVLLGNGTSAIEASAHLTYSNFAPGGGVDVDQLIIGDTNSTLAQVITPGGINMTVGPDSSSGSNVAGASLTLQGGTSTGNAVGGSIRFMSSFSSTSGSLPNSTAEIAAFDNVGNLQLDGGITTGSTSFVNSSGIIQTAAQTNITSLGTLTGLTIGGDLTVNGDTVTFESANADDPHVLIKNTNNGTNEGARLDFNKLRADDGTETGQNLGEIHFTGQDSAQNTQSYGYIIGEIDVGTSGQESGQIVMGVANHDGGQATGFKLTGGSQNDEIDAEIGFGTSSVTTIAGTLTMGSTATLDNSGNLLTNAATATNLVASTSTAVQLGTIELGHASDTTIARSAAGKVTIEGANVQTTQICCTHHNMSLDGGSSTVDYYFPINSLADGSSSGLYYTRVVAAYDGKIVKILFRGNSLPEGSSSNSFGTNSVIYMSRRDHDGSTYYHQTSGFQASETFNGSSQSTVIVPCGVGGANAADWVFEEGDVLGFSLVKNTTATDIDLAATIVWEYTV